MDINVGSDPKFIYNINENKEWNFQKWWRWNNREHIQYGIRTYNEQEARDHFEEYFEELDAKAPDVVNSPSHYRQSSTETIDLIKESMTMEEFHGYLKGACMKYMARYKYKGQPVQDLEKAEWYLKRLIAEVLDVEVEKQQKEYPDDKTKS